MSDVIMVGPAGEPTLGEMAHNHPDYMRTLNPGTVALVLKALLPTEEELQHGYLEQFSAYRFEGLGVEPLVFIRAKQWIKAAASFCHCYPEHEYARTAWHARKWLQGEL